MSGICGIVNTDAAPLETALLRSMTESLRFRGPDRQQSWSEGTVGLGHTLLVATREAAAEQQPLTLEGRVWITADARVDGQAELRRKLADAGQACAPDCTDVELILRAYLAWSEACLSRLIGDFSFAIWDSRSATLFCSRDHLGIKPFFYAASPEAFVFSNTLDTVRMHPRVSSELDELAIADFLLFEGFQGADVTAFRRVRRLPPGHFLVLRDGIVTIDRYWELRIPEVVERHEDPRAEFDALLEQAVSDRLRQVDVGIEMSGGLDSTSIAAVALGQQRRAGVTVSLHGYCTTYEPLIPDEEGKYSKIAADWLGIPISYFNAARFDLFEFEKGSPRRHPEPVHDVQGGAYQAMTDAAARKHRVMLTGVDGDALLSESPKPYFKSLARRGEFLRLASAAIPHAISPRKALWERI